jgi:hypothetical protein
VRLDPLDAGIEMQFRAAGLLGLLRQPGQQLRAVAAALVGVEGDKVVDINKGAAR